MGLNGTAVIEPPKTEKVLQLEGMELELVEITIKSTTPLIMHKWSEKAKAKMREKHAKTAVKGREVRNPQQEYDDATYWLDDTKTRYGFPAVAFKAAMVDAAVAMNQKKTETRRAFHIHHDVNYDGQMLVEIFAPKRVMREDMVTVGMGSADLRYRPEFPEWSAVLRFEFDKRQTSAIKLIGLLRQAGFSTGVGEWRVEKDGPYGSFAVDSFRSI